MNGIKRGQGRPPVPDKKRLHFIKARLTADELERLRKMEENLGVNRSDLLRAKLFDKSEKILLSAKVLIAELDIIGAELGRSGNNINQLARHANVLKKNGGIDSFDWASVSSYFKQYLMQQKAIEITVRKILLLIGS